MTKLRLQKIIANAGICSRRKAEELLIEGRITINGKSAHIGDKANIKLDKITMQNKKDMEVSLYLDIHQPEFNYNDADSFMYAVKQCVDYLNYTTEIEKRIPSSIIIAMAGVESGWGTSRFAIEGNALFGVRTWDSKIPQMKAKGNPDADWGVKKYEHKCESIRDMIEIINTIAPEHLAVVTNDPPPTPPQLG